MLPHPETDPKVQLGELLRLAREQTPDRKTQAVVAKSLGMERSTVAKGEGGDRVPNQHVLSAWLDVLEVGGLARSGIEKMWKLARLTEEDPAQAKVAPWYPTEARAHSLRYWAPVIVPGIIQTPTYAEQIFRAMKFDEAKIAELLQVRLGRQEILTRQPSPPDTTFVIWEAVLHHQIGTRETMRDQCARLLEVAAIPSVALHVLPSSLGANPGLGGAIALAATDDASELLCSGGLVEDQLTQDPAVVHKARVTFSSVRADALNRAASRNALMEATERWQSLTQRGGSPPLAATALIASRRDTPPARSSSVTPPTVAGRCWRSPLTHGRCSPRHCARPREKQGSQPAGRLAGWLPLRPGLPGEPGGLCPASARFPAPRRDSRRA